MNTLDRFWSKVDKSGQCWRWTGSLYSNDYGWFFIGRRDTKKIVVLAHRFAWEITHKASPKRPLRNICGLPYCVKPSHWEDEKRGAKDTPKRRAYEAWEKVA